MRSQKSKLKAARSAPDDSRTYNGPKVHFFATIGEEPEVEVELV